MTLYQLALVVYGLGVLGAGLASMRSCDFAEVAASFAFALLWPVFLLQKFFKLLGF